MVESASSYSKANHRGTIYLKLFSVPIRACHRVIYTDVHEDNQPTNVPPYVSGMKGLIALRDSEETDRRKLNTCHTPFTMSMNFRVSG